MSNIRIYNAYITRGFSLLEMLMALAIFSVTVISLSGLAFRNAQATNEQHFEQIALNLMHNAYEKCQVQSCESVNLSLQEKAAELLPQGYGEIEQNETHCHILISWLNRFSEKNNQLEFQVE